MWKISNCANPELSGTKYTIKTFKLLVQRRTIGSHSIQNKLLAHIIVELLERFVESQIHGVGLLHLLPSQCCSCDLKLLSLKNWFRQSIFTNKINPTVMFPSEYCMWVRKWKLHVLMFLKSC